MKVKFAKSLLIGATAYLASSAAHGFCVLTSVPAIPPNDVGIMGCAATNAFGTFACDMNGTQGRWATHGVAAVEANNTTLSWTRNLLDAEVDKTEEYVCRIAPPGAGTGAVHRFSGMLGQPKSHTRFDCWIAATCD